MSGNFQSENIHVVERYTMFTPDTILFVATIEDSTLYTRPWTLAFSLERNKEPGYYQLEYACHEGERDLQHFTDDTSAGRQVGGDRSCLPAYLVSPGAPVLDDPVKSVRPSAILIWRPLTVFEPSLAR